MEFLNRVCWLTFLFPHLIAIGGIKLTLTTRGNQATTANLIVLIFKWGLFLSWLICRTRFWGATVKQRLSQLWHLILGSDKFRAWRQLGEKQWCYLLVCTPQDLTIIYTHGAFEDDFGAQVFEKTKIVLNWKNSPLVRATAMKKKATLAANSFILSFIVWKFQLKWAFVSTL